jgi:hypothetical protein
VPNYKKSFGSQTPNIFDTKANSPAAYGGFKGDRLNGNMITAIMKQPRIKKKKKLVRGRNHIG